MRKSYSVNDLSTARSADFVDHQELTEDSDEELDNRLIADRYNRELAEMNAAGSSAYHSQGEIVSYFLTAYTNVCPLMNYALFISLPVIAVQWLSHGFLLH